MLSYISNLKIEYRTVQQSFLKYLAIITLPVKAYIRYLEYSSRYIIGSGFAFLLVYYLMPELIIASAL